MNYEELVELLKKEKSNSALSKVEETLYEDMESLLKEKESSSKIGNILFAKEFENAKRLVERIKEERAKKLFYFAFHSLSPSNAIEKEMVLYNEFKSILKRFYSSKDFRSLTNKGNQNPDAEKKEDKAGIEESDNLQDKDRLIREDKKENSKEEDKKEEVSKQAVDNKVEYDEELDDSLIEIKILKSVDAYRGLDGIVYGPFSPGEIVKINKEEAEWLVESGYASKT